MSLSKFFHRPTIGKLALILLGTGCPLAAAEPNPAAILQDMKRVADWQIANPSKHAIHDWTQAPFFLGLSSLYQVSGDARYRDALDSFGKQLTYGPGPRVPHADDHAVLQAWLELYRIDKDPAKLSPSVAHFGKITAALAKETPKSISGGSFTWCWCDALFMSPAVWAHLSQLTGDPKFFEWADREWWTTTDVLFDPTHHLYYRDNNFFTKRTPSGNKVFWSRGNGWVVGGLIHVLDYLPAKHPSREKYLGLYHDMMYALLKLQNVDGLWRSSLLDPQGPLGESSGSAFFVEAMAWGINRGLLPSETFRPAVINGYQALAKNIQPTGMLGFVQKIGDSPDVQDATAESTEVYGSGAFLLAGAEVIRLLDPSKRETDLASFKGVTLPEKFIPTTPRTFARFVPERSDDFAWENDLVAFRTYGPALRPGAENSGIDCWFKRVPYPILNKWYLEDRLALRYSKKNKPYHEDHGEGYDVYHVGNSRGCGGISVWADGEMHDSDTFIAQRVISGTPEKTVFELDYASDLNGKVLRETKRITIIMGQRLFQCDSRFTLDGKPATFDVAIGLMPQVKGTVPVFSPKLGTMQLWEKLDDLGVGTGIAIDPKAVVKMESRTDAAGQTQAFCFARTDAEGHIRWFSGYGWEGQGEITTEVKWSAYLRDFAMKFVKAPFSDDASFKTHSLGIPGPPQSSNAVKEVPGAVMIKPNGGWCWFQDPRVILTKSGDVVFTSISGDTFGGYDAGDLTATSWNPVTGKIIQSELSDKFQSDDHDVAALMERQDGKILAVYGKHSSDHFQRSRITTKPGDISAWAPEQTYDVGDRYSYSNVYRLPAENGRVYNFSRSRGFNPNCNISEDDGSTWHYGWRLFAWTKDDLIKNPSYTGIDGCRPYVRYASNRTDTIHFVTTEDHPRAYDNSIYHGFYKAGKLHDSTGKVLGTPTADAATSLKPTSFTKIFDGGENKVAWTTDLELDAQGNPYTAFSVQMDGAKDRGKRGAAHDGMDHRYYYARFNGTAWDTHQMAYAGTRIYATEDDYTGLVALDPQDPNTIVISTNADPATGTALMSHADQKRHWELYRGKTSDSGKSWNWTPLTHDSTVDNLRPIIPSTPGGKRIILWTRGVLNTYMNFHLDIYGLIEPR
ncbi:MAG: glycoside hydrolase family 88 protein [Luteolibacter sp.]